MDRKKVIKELESLRDICNAKSNMAIGKGKIAWAGYANTADDALNLLKEREAVTEYVMDEYQPTCKACGFRPFAGYIPSLEWMRERGFKFCSHCRQAIKWEEEKTDGNHEND